MLNIITETDGKEYILKLVGRLDVNATAEVEKKFTDVAEKAQKVILDCEELAYMSSAGLRAIRKLIHTMKKRGFGVSTKNVRPEINDILEMTGFAAMFESND